MAWRGLERVWGWAVSCRLEGRAPAAASVRGQQPRPHSYRGPVRRAAKSRSIEEQIIGVLCEQEDDATPPLGVRLPTSGQTIPRIFNDHEFTLSCGHHPTIITNVFER